MFLKEQHTNIKIEAHSYNLHIREKTISMNYKLYDEDMNPNKENNYKYYAYSFRIINVNYRKALKDNDCKLAFLF